MSAPVLSVRACAAAVLAAFHASAALRANARRSPEPFNFLIGAVLPTLESGPRFEAVARAVERGLR